MKVITVNTFSFSGLFLALLLSFSGLQAQTEIEKANKLFELLSFEQAASAYAQIVKSDPNNSLAAYRLGESYYRLYKNAEALNAFELSLKHKNCPPAAAYYAGMILQQAGRNDEAREMFRRFATSNVEFGNRFTQKVDWAIQQAAFRSDWTVAPSALSSEALDFGGSMLPDRRIVFASATNKVVRKVNQSDPSWTGKAKLQLLDAQVNTEGVATKVAGYRSDLKNKFGEGAIAFSANGKRAVFMRHSFENGVRIFPMIGSPTQLFVADVNENGELFNERPFPYNDTQFSSAFPFLSADGKSLLYSSNRPGGKGGFDIWRSIFLNGSWSEPENLGSNINTKGDEISPYQDNGVLYFSSDWFNGFGGQDVFVCKPTDEGYSAPENLGAGVNSAFDDFCFIVNSQIGFGFMTSNRSGGKGYEDIYSVQSPRKKVLFSIIDANTSKSLSNALVDLSACQDKLYKSDKSGQVQASLLDQSCEVVVNLDEYVEAKKTIKTSEGKVQINLQPTFVTVEGTLLDAKTNKPVSNAAVRFTSKSGKAAVNAVTNSVGQYKAKLAIDGAYLSEVSANGYLTITTPVSVGKKNMNKGKQPMMPKEVEVAETALASNSNTPPPPAAQPIAVKNEAPSGKAPITQAATKVPDAGTKPAAATVAGIKPSNTGKTEPVKPNAAVKPAESKPVKTPTSSQPAVAAGGTKPATTTTKPPIKTDVITAKSATPLGFSIQLEAASQNQVLELGAYQPLTSLGNLYVMPEDGKSKLRLGVYSTREQAVEVLSKVKAAGLKDAFIVGEQNAELVKNKRVIAKPVLVPKGYNQPSAAPEKSTYQIRIGAFRSLENLPISKLNDIAPTKVEMKGKLAILYVGSYPSEAAAKAHLPLVKQLGFPDALVEEQE